MVGTNKSNGSVFPPPATSSFVWLFVLFCLFGWLVGWLFVWLVGWLFGWLVVWLVVCLFRTNPTPTSKDQKR